MTTEKIKKSITGIEKENAELESRISGIEEQLFTIKKDRKKLLSDEGQAEIQSLTSSREIYKEVLEENQKKLESLQIQLEEAEKEEAKEGYFETAVEATREAAEAKDKYLAAVKEVDQYLYDKLVAISVLKGNWARANKKFIAAAIKFEPTFRFNQEETEESEQVRSDFLQAVEEKAGVPSTHARTERFLPWRAHREVVMNSNEYKLDLKTPITGMADKVATDLAKQKERELQEA